MLTEEMYVLGLVLARERSLPSATRVFETRHETEAQV